MQTTRLRYLVTRLSGNRTVSGAAAAVGALGVVYGDVGTSPLYALRLAVLAGNGSTSLPAPEIVIGVVSTILWLLIIIVSLKYALLILRADNKGEGGILSLFALLRAKKRSKHMERAIIVFACLGAGLLYGDGTITPAISVLSAIEGLKVNAPQVGPYVLPITVLVLIGLFALQRTGTGFIGRVFGPFMLLWFLSLSMLGISGILEAPEILEALNPLTALHYFAHAGPGVALVVIGAAFLAVTGGEALYADLGHFGRRPIQVAWFAIAFPSLILNYLGQGALLLHEPTAISNPFYRLAPDWALYPLVLLATRVTVIASQAIISGVFSTTQQAMQLGFLPHMQVKHTGHTKVGQIYMPTPNWLIAFMTIAAAVGFGSSEALAGAYGIAVSLLMAITTALAGILALQWGYSRVPVFVSTGLFLAVDVIFFSANSLKFPQGGWFPLLLASLTLFLTLTWRRGQLLLEHARARLRQSETELIEEIRVRPPVRLPGTVVFLSPARTGVPLPLTSFLRHNRALHERVIVLTVEIQDTPSIQCHKRVEFVRNLDFLSHVVLKFGYMETPDVPETLGLAFRDGKFGFGYPTSELFYILGRETIVQARHTNMLQDLITGVFSFMQRNSVRSAAYFAVPAGLVVQIGIEIEM